MRLEVLIYAPKDMKMQSEGVERKDKVLHYS